VTRQTFAALGLIAPLALFLLANFLVPLGMLLAQGVEDREVARAWPQTAAMLRQWDGRKMPDEQIVPLFARELAASRATGTLSQAANRLNHETVGSRTLLAHTADDLPSSDALTFQTLAAIDPRWAESATWLSIRRAAGPWTSSYLLAALDRQIDPEGHITHTPREQAIFLDTFARTFRISAGVAMLCVVLGYPLGYLLANVSERTANVLMIFILLPFWTSVLVRTTAWMVLLQNHGVVNDMLLRSGLTAQPLQLIYNRVGVYIAMTHVLLPYFVLPLYGVMKGIPRTTMRAALSLGATPLRAFYSVYLPQSLPGVTAGALIVFILALGYYITPALVGGAADQMISAFIAFYTNQSVNWGMAAALSLVLLVATLLLVTLYARIARKREVLLR
jgi:putative spermidine/putrescine transport system permease protein